MTFRSVVFDCDVLAFDEARFLQALAERGHPRRGIGERERTVKKRDYWHRLLRAPRNRPTNSRTAEQRDELAPFVAVGTCVSWHAPRPDPYVRLSRIRLLPRVCDGTSCRIRSSACDTRAWFSVQYVLCWCVFPLAPALRSTDTAATAPADASAGGFLRFVRRLHSYYDEVRLLVSVHHRLRLLTFPMRTVLLTQHLTARPETSQVPMRSLCT